jgi:glycosyltransferase involved in cell wall biosynthesis
MTTPRISVAMSVYNNAPYLAHAIESILAQTLHDFEFLIVDDGSTDGSGEIIDRFAADDSRIRPIHQANAGLIVSLNRMIDEARAPLIARMDGDDIALPERFTRQVAFLDANPDIGVLGTGCTCIDEDGRPSVYKFDNVTTPEDVVEDLKNGPPLCHPSVIMRRDAVRAVGGYHRAYKHCEDYDLWLRLSENVRMANLPERLLLYRQSETQVSNRHAYVQKIGAAIAWEAHVERMAGRPDPTESLDALPPMDQLDRIFGREGAFRTVREKVALGIVYTPAALRGEGFDLMLAHIRAGGATDGFWRTVARLFTLGEPSRALRLATALFTK